MHISESETAIILTKCSKMTEQKQQQPNRLNGNSDESTFKGGRLKFFKDGKFILELERAREGERMSWVSVPRKTFWPPQGTAVSTPAYRQENSTSLSVSDDNSSIQSSPWQRDHTWKQVAPRQNQSKTAEFYLWRPKPRIYLVKSRKLRRPYSAQVEHQCNNNLHLRTNKCNKNRRKLCEIIQNLLNTVTTTSDSMHSEVVVVSPRKRFLREMENANSKREIDEKRSRNKSAAARNGEQGPTDDASVNKQKNSNSYSITSLLADDRGVKSPQAQSQIEDQRCVDRLRSMELSQPDKSYTMLPHPSYLPPYMYHQYPLSVYYNPGIYGGGRGYIPPVYTPALPLSIRPDLPSCSWGVDPDQEIDDITDMPLNLSKHGG